MIGLTALNSNGYFYRAFQSDRVCIGSSKRLMLEDFYIEDSDIQSEHCELILESEEKRKIWLKNRGRSIALDRGPRIHNGLKTELDLPTVFWVGKSVVEVVDLNCDFSHDAYLSLKPVTDFGSLVSSELKQSPAPATLAAWFETLAQLQSSNAGSKEYFEEAVRACFCPGGLDGAMILLPPSQNNRSQEWEVVASHICYPEYGFSLRNDLVQQAIQQNVVIFHDSQKINEASEIAGQSAIVCPILDDAGDCRAVLYGFRSQHRRNNRFGIRPMEACFVELIAQNIRSAMLRLESDAAAARTKVLLEHAFSAQVANKLQQNPQILDGQNREVTVMFCDLRGFSTTTEQVDPKVTYEFLTDVMDCFSQLVIDFEGVVIDFYGDGLSAFWNAPLESPIHPQLACLCALEIQKSMPLIADRWNDRLRSSFQVGIGINTGNAQVGNSGSRTRLKYGPRGNTVNLTARLESATKLTKSGILISGDTHSRLPQSFLRRRACRARLAGMRHPTELYELSVQSAGNSKVHHNYEQALKAYEQKQFYEAIEVLGKTLNDEGYDGLSMFLLEACKANIELGNKVVNRPSTKSAIYPLFTEEGPLESLPKPLKKLKENIPEV